MSEMTFANIHKFISAISVSKPYTRSSEVSDLQYVSHPLDNTGYAKIKD